MAPSTTQIQKIFEPLSIQGQQKDFMTHVSDTVQWTILGHSPLSHKYTSKQSFAEATLKFLADEVMTEPLRLQVNNISGGGESSDWATVEMSAIDAWCKNGLKYDMDYCWVCRFDENDMIVEVRAYLCTKLLSDAIEQNAGGKN